MFQSIKLVLKIASIFSFNGLVLSCVLITNLAQAQESESLVNTNKSPAAELLIEDEYQFNVTEDEFFNDSFSILQGLDNLIIGNQLSNFLPIFVSQDEFFNINPFISLIPKIPSDALANIPFEPRPRPPSDPDKIDPFATTIPINNIPITHLTQWQIQVGQLLGEATSSSPDFSGIVRISSDVSTEINENRVFIVEQRGQYLQLGTVTDKRTVTTTKTLPLSILGQHIQMSLTGGCVLPNTPADSICTYTPGISIDPNSIDPRTLLPSRINNPSNFGDIVSSESLEAIRQPGFQRGANGQEIGIDLLFPNTGTVQGNSQASESTLSRQEDLKNAAAAILQTFIIWDLSKR